MMCPFIYFVTYLAVNHWYFSTHSGLLTCANEAIRFRFFRNSWDQKHCPWYPIWGSGIYYSI